MEKWKFNWDKSISQSPVKTCSQTLRQQSTLTPLMQPQQTIISDNLANNKEVRDSGGSQWTFAVSSEATPNSTSDSYGAANISPNANPRKIAQTLIASSHNGRRNLTALAKWQPRQRSRDPEKINDLERWGHLQSLAHEGAVYICTTVNLNHCWDQAPSVNVKPTKELHEVSSPHIRVRDGGSFLMAKMFLERHDTSAPSQWPPSSIAHATPSRRPEVFGWTSTSKIFGSNANAEFKKNSLQCWERWHTAATKGD